MRSGACAGSSASGSRFDGGGILQHFTTHLKGSNVKV
jgi:hypothetical protein